MAGALHGVRVIDFGQYIAGPMTAMFLGDQGADVIRVDPPGGPLYDTPANATWNRNKRSIVLDLKTSGGIGTARRLIETADVLIEGFRPGVMERLGLGAGEMTALNPALIYCSLPGFASDDPRRDHRAWEGIVASATGIYRPGRSGRPTYTALPFSSAYAAFQAAVAIAMALNARERDHAGQVIETPLFDSSFGFMGGRVLRTNQQLGMENVADRPMSNSLIGHHECKDGRWVRYVDNNKEARRFVEASGASEFVDAFRDGGLTPAEFRAKVKELFRTRTAQEWEDFCEEVRTECAVCRPSAEWLTNQGALTSKIVVDCDDPLLGKVRGPGINVRMTGTPPEIRFPRALPDAHRTEILRELETRKARPVPTVEGTMRAALDGVRVLDLCIVLAGPTCGRTLAEFGADVIKIEDPRRASQAGAHNDINRGKRSIILDLKTPAGIDVLMRLVETADVLVQNFRKGVADRVGFGYDAVKRRRPDIVYASLNTYGQVGSYSGRPGHEGIAQAATGMQERYGGDGPPATAPFPVNDYGTGHMGAFGVALALLHRKKTGQGQHVDTALAYTATMLQSNLNQSYEGKKWDEPRGQDALGSGPLNRAYEAADGWLFLAGRARDLQASPDLRDLAGYSGSDLEEALCDRMRTRAASEWVALLTKAGLGAQVVVPNVTDLFSDAWVRSHNLVVTREHDGLGLISTNAPTQRLSRTPVQVGRPAPKPGSDAKSILAEIGQAGQLLSLVGVGALYLEAVGGGEAAGDGGV